MVIQRTAAAFDDDDDDDDDDDVCVCGGLKLEAVGGLPVQLPDRQSEEAVRGRDGSAFPPEDKTKSFIPRAVMS